MSCLGSVCCVVLAIVTLWTTSDAQDTQGYRRFDDVCENCLVSNGMGFITDPDDCNCFYTCVYLKDNNLFPSDWISTKRCCPCGLSWSQKVLTCVEFKDKRSDCFKDGVGDPENPCEGAADGDLVLRRDPVKANGDYLCAGFVRCISIAGTIVSDTDCCAPGDCFDETTQTCSLANCITVPRCAAPGATVDCVQPTDPPPAECQYTSVPDDITKFMGKVNMATFTCAPGTCWDDDLCTCVATNNTSYKDCDKPFIYMDFQSDMLNVKDEWNSYVWAESNEVDFSGAVANFGGVENEYISIGGTAFTFLSNTFIMRIEVTLGEDDTDSIETEECLMGNCFVATTSDSSAQDTISIKVERDGVAGTPGSALVGAFEISIRYQDEDFMLNDGMEMVELDVEGNFQIRSSSVCTEAVSDETGGHTIHTVVGTDYEVWIIYCGDQQFVRAGVMDTAADGALVGTAVQKTVENSKQVLMGQSGFVFGKCPAAADDFEGDIDKVEFWRECKPWGLTEFEEAYDALA